MCVGGGANGGVMGVGVMGGGIGRRSEQYGKDTGEILSNQHINNKQLEVTG